MNITQITKFYNKVIQDFVSNIKKQSKVTNKLSELNLGADQFGKIILNKLKEPSNLYERLVLKQNQIEKEMKTRVQANRVEMPLVLKEEESDSESHFQDSQSESDDLKAYETPHSSYIPIKHDQKHRKRQKSPEPSKENKTTQPVSRKREPSEYSLQQLSDIEQEEEGSIKKWRQKSTMHMLGTYDSSTKRHYPSEDKTKFTMSNVFIKTKGMPSEIYFQKIQCTTEKRTSP